MPVDLSDEMARATRRCASNPVLKIARNPIRQAGSQALRLRCARRGRGRRVRAVPFWGTPMTVVYPDTVSVSIDRYGIFEPRLTAFYARRLTSGMSFLDLGAHFGYFSMLAAHLVGRSGTVHAFEPTPTTHAVLRENLSSVGQYAHPLAAYHSRTVVELNDFGPEYSAFNSLGWAKLTSEHHLARATERAAAVMVTAVPVDDWIEERGILPDFVKIDTEGVELDVLAGMSRLLSGEFGRRPTLTIEVGDADPDDRTSPSRAVVDHMLDSGYSAFETTAAGLRPHEPAERYTYDNLVFEPS